MRHGNTGVLCPLLNSTDTTSQGQWGEEAEVLVVAGEQLLLEDSGLDERSSRRGSARLD